MAPPQGGGWVKQTAWSRTKWIKLMVVALAAGALYFVAQKWGLTPVYERARDLVRSAGPVPFFTAMALLPAVGAPISLFTFPAAAAFAASMGTLAVVGCAILAVTVNAALSYWLAARALRPLAERLVKRAGHEMPEMPRGAEWEMIVLVRIIPGPPLFMQSYLLGLARAPFQPYMIVSVLVSGAYTALTIVAVDGVRRGDPWTLAAAGVVLVAVALTVHRMRVRLQRRRPARKAKGK
jgi:uncharacterized membrane protein YdjX (TVP38/TMEM64 family)